MILTIRNGFTPKNSFKCSRINRAVRRVNHSLRLNAIAERFARKQPAVIKGFVCFDETGLKL